MADINTAVPFDAGAQMLDPSNGGPVRDTDEQKEVQMVLRLYEEGKKARSKYDKDWGKYRDYYDGKQWDEKRPKYRASPVANITRVAIQTITPILTDAQPGFDVTAKEPSDYDFSQFFNELVPDWWTRNGMNLKLLDPILDMQIVGIGYMKVVWDGDAEEGAGDVVCASVDPDMLYFPGEARDFDDCCPWVIQEIWKPVGEVKRKFHHASEKISQVASSGAPDADKMPTGEATLTSPIDRKSTVEIRRSVDGTGDGADNQMVCVLEAWMDDWSIEEYENEQGEKQSRLKYPGGKVIKILRDQKILLESVANPRKDGKKPYVRFIDTIKPRKFIGDGEVGPLMEAQKLVNKALAQIVDYLNNMSNPVWIVDTNSGVSPDQLTNQIGLIITKNPNTEVRRDMPPSLPPYIMDLYQMMIGLADSISGVHDVTQGRKPGGVTAAAAINDLQEAAQTRIRLKERNLQVSLSKLGHLVTATMMQYYKEPRVTKITGKQGWPQYFEFYLKDTEDGRMQYVKRGYDYDENTRRYTPQQDWQEGEPSKGVFDIAVVSGTSLPFMKEKRSQLALTLYKDGVIDDEELLETLDWPRREQLLKRMQEKKQQAMQGAGAPTEGA